MRRVAGLVLAAGNSSRFGSPKALALLDGRPMLEHVLDVAAGAGLDPIVVVLGTAAEEIERGVHWREERRIRNDDPSRGLSSSLRLGLDALEALAPPVSAVVILLGDQPRTDPAVVRALVARHEQSAPPIVVPSYAHGGGSNPVLIDRSVFALARTADGDRGLEPLIAAHPEVVEIVRSRGSNPDVDFPSELTDLERTTQTMTTGRVSSEG